MISLVSSILAGCLAVGSPSDCATSLLRNKVDPMLAKRADSIEVVFADGAYSHLEYSTQPAATSEPARTVSFRKPLESPKLVPFGRCTTIDGKIQRQTGYPCGLMVNLTQGTALLDLLEYDSLKLSATVTGRWTVALADEYLAEIQENQPIGDLRKDGPTSFPLESGATKLDLKRTKLLSFILESPSGSLSLERIDFSHSKQAPAPPSRPAIWMWDNRKAQSEPAFIAADLEKNQVRRVYLQIGMNLKPLTGFVKECRARGIEVYALDGSPEYVERPDPLLARARLVREHNASAPDAAFAGFQIDVEPYLNKDFSVRFEEYGHRYIELVERLREILGAVPLSTVMPFWFDAKLLDNRSLAWNLMSRSSEAVIMSYRTDPAELEAITRTILSYGERLGKPVLLGVETVRIPDERHFVFRRCSADAEKGVALNGTTWCQTREYTVPGDRISFHGKNQAFRERLNLTVQSPAFAGWVIHSYESYPR